MPSKKMPTITHKAVMEIFGIPDQRSFTRFKDACDIIVEDHFTIATSASFQPENIEAAIQTITNRHPLVRIDLRNEAHKSAMRRFVMGIHNRHRSNRASKTRTSGFHSSGTTRGVAKATLDTAFRPSYRRSAQSAPKAPAPQPLRRARMKAPLVVISDSEPEDEPEFVPQRTFNPMATASRSARVLLSRGPAQGNRRMHQPGPQDGIAAVTQFLDVELSPFLGAFINFGFASEVDLLVVAHGRPGSIEGVVDDFEVYCNVKNAGPHISDLHKSLLKNAFMALR